MSLFTAIQDMSNTSLILNSLREIGAYFKQVKVSQTTPKALLLSELPISDDAYKNAFEVFHRLAYHLQNKAQESQKEELSEMLSIDFEIINNLCEGILCPYVKGTHNIGERRGKRLI